ncbi:MAG: flavodoxin family protein [Alphaproteobacteria bacterium]|nr:flavodoxin family protein [Alphaproteobacteria bacterium]
MKIAIPYFSGSGHTLRLAEHVAEGAKEAPGATVKILNVETLAEEDWDFLKEADAVIFGAPTYMGSIAGSFKQFMDQTAGDFWRQRTWADKIAGGFTVALFPSGDKLSTLGQMSVFAAQHGMIWVGLNELGSAVTGDGQALNDNGAWLGLMATSSRDKDALIDAHDAKTARLFGRRIAKTAQRWVCADRQAAA